MIDLYTNSRSTNYDLTVYSYCPAAGVPRGHECPTCRQQAHMVPVTRTNGHVGNGLHMYSCAPHHSQTQMMETVPMLQMPHFRADHYMDTKVI